MTVAHLTKELKSVDWTRSVGSFLDEKALVEDINAACTRIAIWSRELEIADAGNPAISFIRAAQASAHHTVAACSLSLYRASAASIRSLVENGLYYTYFRVHPSELATLIRDPAFHVSRSDLVAYHKVHTPDFKVLQDKLGFIGKLDEWYGEISSIVHGQIPGSWIEHTGIGDIKHSSATLKIVVQQFCRGELILHELFLLTVGRQLWDRFSAPSKKFLLSGLPGEIKNALKLDKA